MLPIIFPNCYGWARPHHHQTAVTNTTASGTQTLPGTSCTAPNPPRQGTNSGEGKTGCVMLGMSHTPLAQPALAFEQGGRQVPEQRAAAACSHPARSWSIQPASVLQFQQLGGNRDLPILAQKGGTWSVYPEFLGMSAEIPKPQKIYCRSSDVTFTQEHTSWQ